MNSGITLFMTILMLLVEANGQETTTVHCKFDSQPFEGFYGKNESGAVIKKNLQCCTLEYQAHKDAKIQLDISEHEYQANSTECVIIRQSNGSIPENIFIEFPKLQLMTIADSNITSLHLNSFKKTTNLKTLIWISCNLEEIEGSDFESLPSLNFLGLTNGAIRSINKNAFLGLAELRGLNLNNNQIKMLDSASFRPLKALENLYLDSNEIEILPAGLFSENKKLKLISMMGNNISKIDSHLFDDLNDLKTVNLVGNHCLDKELNGTLDILKMNLKNCLSSVTTMPTNNSGGIKLSPLVLFSLIIFALITILKY